MYNPETLGDQGTLYHACLNSVCFFSKFLYLHPEQALTSSYFCSLRRVPPRSTLHTLHLVFCLHDGTCDERLLIILHISTQAKQVFIYMYILASLSLSENMGKRYYYLFTMKAYFTSRAWRMATPTTCAVTRCFTRSHSSPPCQCSWH